MNNSRIARDESVQQVKPIPVITFNQVRKSYPKPAFEKKKVVFHNLSFTCHAHTTMGLIGANGAGKSTCIKLMMDFIRPDSGKIKLFGKAPALDHEIRKKIGYLPETVNFPANLNVLNLLNFTGAACEIPGKKIKERGQRLLEQLELWEVRKQLLRTYSKGMQQRASFAVALINNPSLLILDEPMSGLDPLGRQLIIDLIMELKNQGKTILFCSHILQDVDLLADEILILHKGKKLFTGPPDNLYDARGDETLTEKYLQIVKKEANA